MRRFPSGCILYTLLSVGVLAVIAGVVPVRSGAAMPAMTPPPPASAGRSPTPPVRGFYNGQEITFIHTEASDPKVAEMLTRMMGPKVLVVPGLAQIPERLLAQVYVFANGVEGQGPFGFQPDLFDSAPGDATYTPLRRVNLVSWRTGVRVRVVRSVAELERRAVRGELLVRRSEAVVNMPFLTWPGGHR